MSIYQPACFVAKSKGRFGFLLLATALLLTACTHKPETPPDQAPITFPNQAPSFPSPYGNLQGLDLQNLDIETPDPSAEAPATPSAPAKPEAPKTTAPSASLTDFAPEAFAAALNSDKLVVLYFYANWCPICRAEYPKMQQAFAELKTNDVVGFRVSFKDDEVTPEEEALAKEHGIAYQHTKVFIRNGERILKAPDSWEKDRYISEINQNLN